jgi:hypothetical protein
MNGDTLSWWIPAPIISMTRTSWHSRKHQQNWRHPCWLTTKFAVMHRYHTCTDSCKKTDDTVVKTYVISAIMLFVCSIHNMNVIPHQKFSYETLYINVVITTDVQNVITFHTIQTHVVHSWDLDNIALTNNNNDNNNNNNDNNWIVLNELKAQNNNWICA